MLIWHHSFHSSRGSSSCAQERKLNQPSMLQETLTILCTFLMTTHVSLFFFLNLTTVSYILEPPLHQVFFFFWIIWPCAPVLLKSNERRKCRHHPYSLPLSPSTHILVWQSPCPPSAAPSVAGNGLFCVKVHFGSTLLKFAAQIQQLCNSNQSWAHMFTMQGCHCLSHLSNKR